MAAAATAAADGDIFLPTLPSLPRLSDVTGCVATPIVTSLRLADQSATTGQFIFLLRHAAPRGYFYRLVYAGGLRTAAGGRIPSRNAIRNKPAIGGRSGLPNMNEYDRKLRKIYPTPPEMSHTAFFFICSSFKIY